MGYMDLTYNSRGKVTSVKGWQYPVTTMTYAPNGVDLTGITDGLGTITLTYDGTHDVTSLADRSGKHCEFYL